MRGFTVHRTLDPTVLESAPSIGRFIEAHGSGLAYEQVDIDGYGDYYYFIQEHTSMGPGARSELVKAVRLNDGDQGTGGRRRERALR